MLSNKCFIPSYKTRYESNYKKGKREGKSFFTAPHESANFYIFIAKKITAPRKSYQNDLKFYRRKYNINVSTGLQNQGKMIIFYKKK